MKILNYITEHKTKTMKSIRKVLLLLAVAMICYLNPGYAQVEVRVRARPHMPHYERVAAPSPRHVWIDEDWEPNGKTYVFHGGRWAEPPSTGGTWVAGHWRQRHGGWVWIPGHWR